MLLSRILKIIWLIVGLFLLLGIPTLAYLIWKAETGNKYDEPSKDGLMIGEKVDKFKAQGLQIQGIQYGIPEEINQTNTFLLPVFAKTFDEALKIQKPNNFEEVSSLSMPEQGIKNYSFYWSGDGAINILFLNQKYKVIQVLLDRKAFIQAYRIPQDEDWRYMRYEQKERQDPTTAKNITYLIAFDDSNKDGVLNDEDNADLYISGLDGGNLKQATNGLDIIDYHFMRNNGELLIEYNRREKKPEEHKKKMLARYIIGTNTFSPLENVHGVLNKIEEDLLKKIQ